MLNFKNSLIVFLATAVIMYFQYYHAEFSLWYFAIPILLFSSLLFYGSYFIQSNFFINALCHSTLEKKEISLSFDDGPVETTNKILDILKEKNVPSAFFCIGKRMLENPTILKRIHEEGHVIGNHSFTHHTLFDLMSKKKMKLEMQRTNSEAKKTIGEQLLMIRPPYGVTTPVLANAIKEEGFKTIGWSLRTYDTMIDDKQKLVHKIISQIKAGDIILLHDTQNVTVSALEDIINKVRLKGYTFVRLDHLLNIKAYA